MRRIFFPRSCTNRLTLKHFRHSFAANAQQVLKKSVIDCYPNCSAYSASQPTRKASLSSCSVPFSYNVGIGHFNSENNRKFPETYAMSRYSSFYNGETPNMLYNIMSFQACWRDHVWMLCLVHDHIAFNNESFR